MCFMSRKNVAHH